MRTEILQKIDF